MIPALDVLMQSELFVQLFVIVSVVLLVVLTYIFGFKSNNSDNNNQEEKQQSRQSAARQSIGKQSKKQQKSQEITQPQSIAPDTPKQTKKVEPKSQKTTKKQVKPEVKVVEKKPEVVEKVEVNNDESNGEWITVKDKKATKKTPVDDKPVQAVKEVKVNKPVETEVTKVQAPVEQNTEENNWITVTDKKAKKNSITKLTPEPVAVVQPVEATEPSPSSQKKKNKKNKAAEPETAETVVTVPVVQTVPVVVVAKNEETVTVNPVEQEVKAAKLELVTPSLSETSAETDKNDESEWIPANSKAIKKDKKVKVAAQIPAPVVTATKPEPSPKAKKQKPVKPVESESLLLPVKAVTEVVVPVVQPQTTNLVSTPDAIAAAIIDSFKNDNNNNLINKTNRKSTGNSDTGAQQSVVNTKKTKTSTVNMSNLKQTNLSDSMILIDSTTSNLDDNNTISAKNSSRTESNQSSSESLQDLDVDGDDGWATITSKKLTKRTTVRREQ